MEVLNMIKKIITLDFVRSRIERYLAKHDNIIRVTGWRLETFFSDRKPFAFYDDCNLIEENEHAFVDSSDDKREKTRLILLSSLVRSYLLDDVHCAVTLLQDLLLRARTPKQRRKAMLLLAIGDYRFGNYRKSTDYVSRCLEIQPRWRRAMDVEYIVCCRSKKVGRRYTLMAYGMAIGLVTGLLQPTILLFEPTWVMEALASKFLTVTDVKQVVTGSLPDNYDPLQIHEEMYLLAHRYFIRGRFEDIPRCNYLIDRCLEIAPEWKPAMTLKRRIKYARVKAYINELVYHGVLHTVVGMSTVLVLRSAGL